MEGTFLTTAEWLYPIVQKMQCFRQSIMRALQEHGVQVTPAFNVHVSCFHIPAQLQVTCLALFWRILFWNVDP